MKADIKKKISILELNTTEIKKFFLSQKAYTNISLPTYFKFENLLIALDEKLQNRNLNDIQNKKASDLEDINYKIFTNKNDKLAWRKLELLNPVIYVLLVNLIVQNWETIKNRFKKLKCEKICVGSIPVLALDDDKKFLISTKIQINHWWEQIEQQSLQLVLKYKYIVKTDIGDCYGSLYTHTIAWALAGKEIAKKNKNKNIFYNKIDFLVRQMTNNQTNGIPQGSTLMDFIAEIVLAYCDKILKVKIKKAKISEYQILRYRDDYRIFSNSLEEAEKILKLLNDTLKEIGFKLNEAKTQICDEIILNSVKKDKIYAISTHNIGNQKLYRKAQKLYRKALNIYDFSLKFPNSGSLTDMLNKFAKKCKKLENLSAQTALTIISIIFAISENSPRYYNRIIMVISHLLKWLDKSKKDEVLKDIYEKIKQRPHNEFAEIWFQRIDRNLEFEYESKICNCTKNGLNELWNNSWLKPEFRKIFKENEVIDMDEFKRLGGEISKDEISSNLYDEI